jgi:hypothetical protein
MIIAAPARASSWVRSVGRVRLVFPAGAFFSDSRRLRQRRFHLRERALRLVQHPQEQLSEVVSPAGLDDVTQAVDATTEVACALLVL